MLLKFWSDLVIKDFGASPWGLGCKPWWMCAQCTWYTNMYIWWWWMTQRILLTISKKEALFFKTCILSWHALKKYSLWFHEPKKEKCVSWHNILIDVILAWDLIIFMSKECNSKSFNYATCNYLKWLKIISLKMF